ncbi:MAG TPA: NAD(P)H-binding protein [Cyclobacteriaceae bacterium]
MSKSILVLGGTGKTGRRVAECLINLKHPVRIGSRSGNPKFDWEDPATWAEALKDISKVYISFQPDVAVPGADAIIREFVHQAKIAGVEKVVLLSGRGEPEAQECEKVVIASGLDWTIVKASWFSQNFSEGIWLDSVLAGHLALPATRVAEPFVDVDDIAAVAVASLVDDAHSKKIYELTGPRMLTFEQAAKEISEGAHIPIAYEELTIDQYTEVLKEYQVSADVIELITYLFTEVLDGRNAYVTNDVENVLGRKATDFAEYVRKTAATGVWAVRNSVSN